MRKSIMFLLIMISINMSGQNPAECGADNDPELTQAESEFLNVYLSDEQRDNFDFTKKKVIFITGPGASRIGTKTEFFNYIKEWQERGEKNPIWTVALNEKEKIDSGGYDVIVTYWVKLLTKRRQRIIIKEIKTSS